MLKKNILEKTRSLSAMYVREINIIAKSIMSTAELEK